MRGVHAIISRTWIGDEFMVTRSHSTLFVGSALHSKEETPVGALVELNRQPGFRYVVPGCLKVFADY